MKARSAPRTRAACGPLGLPAQGRLRGAGRRGRPATANIMDRIRPKQQPLRYQVGRGVRTAPRRELTNGGTSHPSSRATAEAAAVVRRAVRISQRGPWGVSWVAGRRYARPKARPVPMPARFRTLDSQLSQSAITPPPYRAIGTRRAAVARRARRAGPRVRRGRGSVVWRSHQARVRGESGESGPWVRARWVSQRWAASGGQVRCAAKAVGTKASSRRSSMWRRVGKRSGSVSSAGSFAGSS